MYSVALHHFGDELPVRAVGIGDESIIHFTDTQDFIHNHLRITLLQFGLSCKEVGTANFYDVGRGHWY